MSRYYDISIPGAGLHWTSHPSGPSGLRDPGALNVELDLNLIAGDQAMGLGFVRVWGVGLNVITQAKNLANQPITVKAGMGSGLPLCNPAQAGLVAQGLVFQFLGNREGVNQSIDIQISSGGYGPLSTQTPGPNPAPTPLNGTLNWKKGQPLGPALKQTLQQMFPKSTVNLAISQNIVAPFDQPGVYSNLYELSTYIRGITQQILGGGKPGVSIVPFGDNVYAFDGSAPSQAGVINYTDLIGQPTWIDIGTITLKCVMRADIIPGQTIQMPSNTVALGQLSEGSLTNQASFQGAFVVNKVRQVGNFRQPDGSAWCTVIEAYPQVGAS